MIFSLVLSLTISAVNLTFLSTWVTVFPNYGSTMKSEPLDYPSVYIGLENVVHNTSQCLNRPTFPDNFYTYDAREGSEATLSRVYAPEDEVTLTFGGPVSLQPHQEEEIEPTTYVHISTDPRRDGDTRTRLRSRELHVCRS